MAEFLPHILVIPSLSAVSHFANLLFFLILSHFVVKSDVIILCRGNITHVFRTNSALEFGHEKIT